MAKTANNLVVRDSRGSRNVAHPHFSTSQAGVLLGECRPPHPQMHMTGVRTPDSSPNGRHRGFGPPKGVVETVPTEGGDLRSVSAAV